MKKIWFNFGLLFLSIVLGCQKEESSILTGTIEGKVNLIDQHLDYSSNNSGVNVVIMRDTFQRQIKTDENGIFTFSKVPYGIYAISCQKDGYIKPDNELVSYEELRHVGGFANTRKEIFMYQIPTYEISLDSITKDSDPLFSDHYLIFYAKTSIPLKSHSYYSFRCFFSESSLVSKDLFSLMLPGFNSTVKGNVLIGRIVDNYSQIKKINASKIYIRIYPEAYGHYYYSDQFLGNPSNTLPYNLN